MFTAAEATACRRLLDLALEEDLGANGDLTSQAVIPPELPGRAALVARAAGVVAGLPAAEMAFSIIDPQLSFQTRIARRLGRGARRRAGRGERPDALDP